MKDIPIWARWNGQELLGIQKGERGWHTFTLRKTRPTPAHSLLRGAVDALIHPWVRLIRLTGMPWRRLGARKHRRLGT